MKIAFVYDSVFPWVTGGAERRIYEIAKRLSKRGHDVHMYCLAFWQKSDEFSDVATVEYDGIIYHGVGDAVDLYGDDNTRSIREALYFSRKLLSVDFSSFDIVDCQGFPYFSCYSSKIKTMGKDTKLVITLHEVWNDYWYEYMGRKGFFGKLVERGIFRLTDNVICVSQLTKNNMLVNHNPSNCVIIPNGVDIAEVTYLDPSETFCDVLFAGRLTVEKHVDLLVKAVKKVVKVKPFIKCRIIGDGPMRTYLEQLVGTFNLEDNIVFDGFYDDHKELYRVMKSSFVFVLPSIREGFGIVVVEANSCGVPVITLNSPLNAAQYLVSEDTGWVVEDSVDSLASTLIKCFEDGISHQMRDNCRHFARGFDWNEVTRLTEEFYMSL